MLELIEICIGLIAVLAISLTGSGGAILLVPALTEIVKVSVIEAVGTVALFVAFAKTFVIASHLQQGNKIEWRQISPYLLWGVFGAFVSAGLINVFVIVATEPQVNLFQDWLKKIIAVVIFTSIWFIVRTKSRKKVCLKKPTRTSAAIWNFFVGIGVAASGAGILIVLRLIACGMDCKQSAINSLPIGILIAFVTGAVHMSGNGINIVLAFNMAIGGVFGLLISKWVTPRTNNGVVKWLIVLFAVGSASKMLFFS